MFKFLKEKLKGALSKISKEVEEEVPDEEIEVLKEEQKIKKPKKKITSKKKKKEKEEPEKEEVEEPKEEFGEEIKEPEETEEKKGFFSKLFKKKEVKEEPEKEEVEEPKEEVGEEIKEPEETEEKKGFFAKLKEKVVTKKISTEKFDKLFWELELALLENNVAVEVVEKIKADLKEDLVDKPINRAEVSTTLQKSLKKSVEKLLKTPTEDLAEEIKKKKEKPYVIAFVGVNGSGKTTTIARMTHLLQQQKLTCVLVAADTFRAGAKEQLKEWATKLKVNMIAHDYGSDPAAVCYDGIAYAKKQKADVVLIDTAGRQHSNVNLVKQMEKIMRIAKPDKKIFVGESITGNDVVTQAKAFDQSVGIDGIILTKVDVDEKGGATISVSYITRKPILYIGTGQELGDLEPFDPEKVITTLGLKT